jgi:hypothetical protein
MAKHLGPRLNTKAAESESQMSRHMDHRVGVYVFLVRFVYFFCDWKTGCELLS